MNSVGWHASDEVLRQYAQGEGGIAVTSSVEAHLLRCPVCRDRIATEVSEPLDAVWTRIADQVQTPRRPVAVRFLRRSGLRETDAVLLSAARSLGGAWTLATVAVVVFAALAAMPGSAQGRALYLLVSPLVPVLGVVVAFASVDPLAELTAATPYPKARLGLLRTAAVAITSVPLSIAIGLAVPNIEWLAFAWLLPAIALTLVALVAMTWWAAEPVGIAVSGAWAAVIAAAYERHELVGVVGIQSQLVYLVLAALAAGVLTLRLAAARTPGGYA